MDKPKLKQPQPFLMIPVAKGSEFKVTEGWLYSAQEKSIHGYANHGGVDFAAPRGTPVYAAADGWALSSFQSGKGMVKKHKSKSVGLGMGRFVQIWHPQHKVYTQYGHLEGTVSYIPFWEPLYDGSVYRPDIIYHPLREILKFSKPVRCGDLIGWMGDSGLSWGYNETPHWRPHPDKYPSWDEVHVHFEVFVRDKEGKKVQWDPFGLYGLAPAYRSMLSSERGLWLTDRSGKPKFSR